MTRLGSERRTRRTLVTSGVGVYGPDIPPPRPGDPETHTEWELLRKAGDGWIVGGSALGPTWMPDAINGAVIWVAWVIFGVPREARRSAGRPVV